MFAAAPEVANSTSASVRTGRFHPASNVVRRPRSEASAWSPVFNAPERRTRVKGYGGGALVFITHLDRVLSVFAGDPHAVRDPADHVASEFRRFGPLDRPPRKASLYEVALGERAARGLDFGFDRPAPHPHRHQHPRTDVGAPG